MRHIADHGPESRLELRDPEKRSRLERLIAVLASFYGGALAVGVLATIAFGWLADEVLEAEFAEVNRSILLAVHTYSSPTLDQVALAVTWLGSGVGVAVLTAIFLVLLLRGRRFVDAWILLVAVIGGGILSGALKLMYHQDRPRLFPHLQEAAHFSFPSGHSLISFVFWGFLAVWLILASHRDPRRWMLGIVCILIASAVAVSRLYIGVHWPTDLVAGFLVAVVWLAMLFMGRQWLTDRRERRRNGAGEPAASA